MIRVFIVFVSIISADMTGDEILLMIDADAIRVDSQAEFGAGITVGDGIGVGLDFDAELGGKPGGQRGHRYRKDEVAGVTAWLFPH